MSFRCRQKLVVPHCSPVFSVEMSTLENGDMVPKSVDEGARVLPEAELFDLDAQLKAGINLEEVSSKVISKRNVTLPQKVIDSILSDGTQQQQQQVSNTNKE